jgi:hypothetical protein
MSWPKKLRISRRGTRTSGFWNLPNAKFYFDTRPVEAHLRLTSQASTADHSRRAP